MGRLHVRGLSRRSHAILAAFSALLMMLGIFTLGSYSTTGESVAAVRGVGVLIFLSGMLIRSCGRRVPEHPPGSRTTGRGVRNLLSLGSDR